MDARIADFLTNAGLGPPVSWPVTLAWALGWLILMLIATPAADWIAGRLFRPRAELGSSPRPTPGRVFTGLIAALIVAGLIEEIVLRGMVLRWVEYQAACRWGLAAGYVGGIGAAAVIGGLIRLYRGTRAALTAGLLSALLGGLYVLSGYDLWACIICHGLYEAIGVTRAAFRRRR